MILRGKNKPQFTPHTDTGDFVVVINAAQIKLTGNKLQGKNYYRHTDHAGGLRVTTAQSMLDKHPERVLEIAVKGMLPRTPMGRKVLTKLKVYSGSEHPHTAQQPTPLVVTKDQK
jgi:large subunit ribosomal protein L13